MRTLTSLCLLATATTMRCGPTPQEIGQLVLSVTPVVFALGAVLVWLVLWQWRGSWPARKMVARPLLWGVLALSVPAVPAAVALNATLETDLLVVALWLYGCSYASLLLLGLRACLHRPSQQASVLSHLLPLAILWVPAAMLALGLGVESWLGRNAEDYFTMPGMGGWVPGGLLLLLLVEARVRRWRAAQAPLDGKPS